MSNKEVIQTNNTRLNINNNSLKGILNTINNLPEAGTGGATNIKITNARYLFDGGARLEYMDEFLAMCENVTDTAYMFKSCDDLTSLDLSNFDTSNSTDMASMFAGCSKLASLNISNFDTSNVTDLQYMFQYAQNLLAVDLSNFDTSNVTTLKAMFYTCRKLTSLDFSSFDTTNVTDTNSMFHNCVGLTELDLSNFDMSKAIDITNMFNGCSNLVNIISFKNLGKGFTQKSNNYSKYQFKLTSCTKLTHDSLMDIINNLYDLNLTYDVANGGTLYTQALMLGATNKAKLTADEIAVATNKGWTVT